VCVECLIGKQKKPILLKVTEPSSVPYRAPSACAKMAAYSDPPPVILVPESIAAQAAYQVCVESLIGKQKKPILFVTADDLESCFPHLDVSGTLVWSWERGWGLELRERRERERSFIDNQEVTSGR